MKQQSSVVKLRICSVVILVHVSIRVLLAPETSHVLRNIWIAEHVVNDACVALSALDLLLKEVHDRSRLVNFESIGVVGLHSIPGLLTSNSVVLSSVNMENLTSDHLGVLRSQMRNNLADLLDSGSSTHRISVSLLAHE